MEPNYVYRSLESWQQDIQAVIDSTVDLDEYRYKSWRKDRLLDFGLKLRKDAVHHCRKPVTRTIIDQYGVEHSETFMVRHYDVSQTEPITVVTIISTPHLLRCAFSFKILPASESHC